MKLNDPVNKIPLIGPSYKKSLERLNIYTVKDLLFHIPNRHEDTSKLFPIDELKRDEPRTFKAEVIRIRNQRTRKRGFSIQNAILEDEGGERVETIWFNQAYLIDSLKEGRKYLFRGVLNPKKVKPQIINPQFEEIKKVQTHLGRIVPIYPLTEGVSNKWLRSRILWLLEKIEYIVDLEESFDMQFLEKYKLETIKQALKGLHFPQNHQELKKSKYRFAFEEMLQIQKKILQQKLKQKKQKTFPMKTNHKDIEKVLAGLDFKLTKDQKTTLEDVIQDLKSTSSIKRLISGDVGSGKTIIAVLASLIVTKNNFQTAILAPTTILASQHYKTFQKLLGHEAKIELVISSNKSPKEDADVFIGTHALLFKQDKLLKKVGLLVIDEEHRFGVKQRESIASIKTDQTYYPHTLSMTATPIPRTMALTLFADINVSQIKTKPLDRKPVKSYLVPETKRDKSYKWITQMAKSGTQCFWVVPLIEEKEQDEIKSIEKTTRELKKELSTLKIASLHGKLKEEEKENILEQFRNYDKKKINVLVSTSVIEVGIDVPNANIIVIEGAERFGLAQLHQLRGRVGRSKEQAWCFLFTSEKTNDKQIERLKYFASNNDGFDIAEYDLANRGPGEVYGVVQSGIPNLKIASIFDHDLIKTTRKAAEELIDEENK